jgi:hypothetical protein
MAIETSEQVKQFLILSQKNAAELRAICEGLKLETTGDQETLLDRLVQLGAPQQVDFMQPQMIPLRTRDERGKSIEPAAKAIYHWRGQIFNAKNNYKEFKMLNSRGQLYNMKMRYILCNNTILQKILDEKWYDPRYTAQGELINLLRSSPERFNVSIVQRTSQKGTSYVMLHAEPKAA